MKANNHYITFFCWYQIKLFAKFAKIKGSANLQIDKEPHLFAKMSAAIFMMDQ